MDKPIFVSLDKHEIEREQSFFIFPQYRGFRRLDCSLCSLYSGISLPILDHVVYPVFLKDMTLRLSTFFRLLVTIFMLMVVGAISTQAAESPPGRQRKASHDPTSPRRIPRVSKHKTPTIDEHQHPAISRLPTRASGKSKQKKITELIWHQEPPSVVPRILGQANPKNVSIRISLSQQRIYLKVGEEIAIDSPISSGKAAGTTPRGQFTILQKDIDHRSSVYGNFVNKNGEIVRAGVSLKIDSAPSGTTYIGAPMKWFMRLTWSGVGMHAGVLPGYPASHGCIRLPEPIAKIIYDCVKVGTLVVVKE